MPKETKDTRITIRMPRRLRKKLEAQAARKDISLAERIVEVCTNATRQERVAA